MGDLIDVPSNGGTVPAYLAEPEGGAGPGLVVIQEWWGLVPHIEHVCDRLAEAGFAALAPDLYHGEKTTEPDEAGKLMMGLRLEQALKDMGGAADTLAGRTGGKVGVIGFCMGGGLALILAAERPDVIGACVPFYGAIPWEGAEPDWSGLGGPVQAHVGTKDDWALGFVNELAPKLAELGKEIEVFTYEGAEHAFFNDDRPEVHDEEAASTAAERAVAFLHAHLGAGAGEPAAEE